ncbi:MAG: hypothetical protein AAFV71_32425 [Cyanobacteria bacterium J06633_8]
MTLSGNSKFPPDIKAMINGETQLSADVINEFLQDLLDRTQYCKTHLEALQTYLGVQQSPAWTEETPAFDDNVLKNMAEALTPNAVTKAFPANKFVSTDENGRIVFADKSTGGNSTPTPSNPGIMGGIYLSENSPRSEEIYTRSTIRVETGYDSLSGDNKLWIPQPFTDGVEWGENIVSDYLYFRPSDGALSSAGRPDANSKTFLPGRFPEAFNLKKGIYMIDAVIPFQFTLFAQSRLSNFNQTDFSVNKATYGSIAFTHRNKNANPEVNDAKRDFVTSCTHLHTVIDESFFNGQDEATIALEAVFGGWNEDENDPKQLPASAIAGNPSFVELIFGLGVGKSFVADEAGVNNYRQLRIVKVG